MAMEWEDFIMWIYMKALMYPVNIKKRDLKMAKLISTQYGGPQGELGAALRYLNQRFTMPDEEGEALLSDIGTEELSHVEMIQTMIHQLMEGATLEEIKEAGLEAYYVEHGNDIFPSNPDGVPFTTAYISSVGDAIANLTEDLAAEEKARIMYEHLIDLATDPDVIAPLLFLRQREVVHYERFKELLNKYTDKLKKD